MNGFECYTLYHALRLHFINDNYDYFYYNGKTQVSQNTYLTHKNKYFFEKMSKKYNDEIPGFYLSNLIENPKVWIFDLTTSESHDIYLEWKKRTQSLSYVFENDIDTLFKKSNINKLIEVNSSYPLMLKSTLRKEISIETLIISNSILRFFKVWEKGITDDIIWSDFRRKCLKYSPFIKFDTKKFKSILVKKAKEYA